jgi:hypothetical protein
LLTVGPAELGDGIDELVVEVGGPPQPGLGVGRQNHARARPAATPVRTQPATEGRRVGVGEDAAVVDQAGEHLLAESAPLRAAAAVGLLRKLGLFVWFSVGCPLSFPALFFRCSLLAPHLCRVRSSEVMITMPSMIFSIFSRGEIPSDERVATSVSKFNPNNKNRTDLIKFHKIR